MKFFKDALLRRVYYSAQHARNDAIFLVFLMNDGR